VDIADWLQGLGLARYEAVFRDNAIDAETLSELTETDLEKLGVLLGHRKRMLRAIQDLRAGPPPAALAPEAAAERAERRQLTVMFCDPCRLDAAVRTARSRGSARNHRRLPSLRHRGSRRFWRICRPLHGRRRPGLFRLSAGA
jgi:hypothetical protein